MEISVEMNLDLNVIDRTSYNILDLLSDIGGIWSVLVWAVFTLLSVFNYNKFDDAIITRFFKVKDDQKSSS